MLGEPPPVIFSDAFPTDRVDQRASCQVAGAAGLGVGQRGVAASKRLAGAEEQHLGSAVRNAEHVCDLLVREPVHVLEQQGRTVPQREAGECPLEHLPKFRLLEGVGLRCVDLLGEPVDDPEGLAPAQLVEAGVHGDSIEPGPDAHVHAATGQPAKGLDEDLLGDVHGFFRVTEQTQSKGVDGLGLLVVELREGGVVAGAQAFEQTICAKVGSVQAVNGPGG